MDMEEMLADEQQTCDPRPSCAGSALLDDQACSCVEKTVANTACKSGQMSYFQGTCVCVLVSALQCSVPGYKVDTSNNCDCKDPTGSNYIPATCPRGYIRPTSTACYCVEISDPACPVPTGELHDNKCTCEATTFSTPECAISAGCGLDTAECSCITSA